MKRYYNAMSYAKLHHKQAGMTLIELTVVLLVLIGLAGLLIPYVSGFISRTHDSTGTSNLAALNGNVQRFQVQYQSLPDNLHSLIETGTTNVYGSLMNTSMFTPVTYTSDGTMPVLETETALSSLLNSGLSAVYDMKLSASNGSKTFDAANASVPVPMPMGTGTDSITLAKINAGDKGTVEGHLAFAFGNQPNAYDSNCYDYVVMGIGQESEMIGRTMADAPVHFAQNGDMGPEKKYNRFAAVFQVDKTQLAVAPTATTKGCSAGTEAAKFIGSAMIMMPAHLTGLGAEMNSTYANIAIK